MATRVQVLVPSTSSAVKADKKAEVEAWYVEHRVAVARHVLALTGRPSQVDDLVTETFIRAFQAFDAYAGDASVRSWLLGIARNVVRNERAKAKRRRVLGRGAPTPEPMPSTPEDEVRRRRALDRFYAAVDALSADLRDVFVMRVIEQRKLKDIADALGIPLSTIHARVSRAEARVRALVEQGDVEA